MRGLVAVCSPWQDSNLPAASRFGLCWLMRGEMMLFFWDTSCNRQHQWREFPLQPQPAHLPQEHKPCAISGARGMRLMKPVLKALAHATPKVVPTYQQPPSNISTTPHHVVPHLTVLGPRGWWIWMSQQCAEPATVQGIWGKERKQGMCHIHPTKSPCTTSLSPAASSTVSPPRDPSEVCLLTARVPLHSSLGLG